MSFIKECKVCNSRKPGQQWYSGPLCTRCWQKYNREKTRQRVNECKRARYHKNKDVVVKQNYESRLRNIEKHRDWRRKYEINKRKTDIIYKMSKNLRCRLWDAIKTKTKFSKSTKNLIGCEFDYLKKYLESRFTSEMNWGNYGSYWHIDHIKPLSSFDLTEDEQVVLASNFKNMQPLEAKTNLKKHAKLNWSSE